MDLKYMLRRLTFALEVRGISNKLQLISEELLSMFLRIRPKGLRQIKWIGPAGDLILNYYDSIVCWRSEIIDDTLYDIKLKSENPVIIDIGANQGFFTLYQKYQYPDAIIYAYEPVKQSFEVTCLNVTDNKFNNIHLANVGVDKEECIKPIYHKIGAAGLGDSVVNEHSGNQIVEQCKFVNLDNSDLPQHIDLIKIDAEGAEFGIIDGTKFWTNAQHLIIEFHDNFKAELGSINKDYIKAVQAAGFKLVKRTGTLEDVIYVCYFEK